MTLNALIRQLKMLNAVHGGDYDVVLAHGRWTVTNVIYSRKLDAAVLQVAKSETEEQ
jgi:hypothetical protein